MTQSQVALVTGASSGIGQATASLLAAAGFHVFGTSRAPEAAPKGPFALLAMDVGSDASVNSAVREVLEQTGRIDVLVNNAGYTQTGAIEEVSVADAQAQFDTNVFGVLRVTQAVLPSMRRQGSGRIINVSSVLGHVAPPYLGVYASTKFALEGLSEALRGELRPFGIHVSLVEPGFVKTSIAGSGKPNQALADYDPGRKLSATFVRQGLARGLDADVVARTIVDIATSRRPGLRYRVGGSSALLIMLKRLLPETAFERIGRRVFLPQPG
jgi:NAD(P)-dependent dehydrogenase (short-subunit alcohol dehydrogenase family)